MRDCPRCNSAVDGLICGQCGYTEATTSNSRKGGPCEMPGCHRWGTFKPETKLGPWHCFKHYPAVPMPAWFKAKHPEFAKLFKPVSEEQLEREALQDA